MHIVYTHTGTLIHFLRYADAQTIMSTTPAGSATSTHIVIFEDIANFCQI